MNPGRLPGAAISCILLCLCLSYLPAGFAQIDPTVAQLTESFAHPLDDCRIMMRWWWFGPAVTKPEIQRELEQMKAAGIGGVEIATLYPQALGDLQTGFRNLPYLSDEYMDALRFTASEATRLGLRIDVTLGSGWPFGGPHIPVTQAAGEMRVETVAIPANARSIVVPGSSTGEQLIAVFLVPGSGDALAFPQAKPVPISAVENGRLKISTELTGPSSVVFFISSRTGMMVKRPAVGAEGFVLDHYDQNATENHLHSVGDRLLEAFGDHPPYAVFSDSLEDYGSNWTGDLLEQFRQRRGYDLMPHLPALVADAGPETGAVRHDWSKTLTELTNERFLAPLHLGAAASHAAALADLWIPSGYAFEQPVRRSSRRRGQGDCADVAAIFGHALGGICRAPVRQACDLIGNLDMAALPGLSCHTARYESGSGLAFPAGDQPVGGARLALLAAGCGRAGMAHVRRRRLQRT